MIFCVTLNLCLKHRMGWNLGNLSADLLDMLRQDVYSKKIGKGGTVWSFQKQDWKVDLPDFDMMFDNELEDDIFELTETWTPDLMPVEIFNLYYGGKRGGTGGYMDCEYVRDYYGVPACIRRKVICYGKPGVIVEDRGNYIGVTLDSEKPGTVSNYHPTDGIEYQGMGMVRKPSHSQARYQRYLEYGDGFNSFLGFCRWDPEPERSWRYL